MTSCRLHVELPLGPFTSPKKTHRVIFRVTPERKAEFAAKYEAYTAYRRDWREAFQDAYPYTRVKT